MLESLWIVVRQGGVLFLMIGVGYLLGRMGKLDGHTIGQLSYFLIYVICPCLMVNALYVPFSPSLLRALGWGCLLLAVQFVAIGLLSGLTFRRMPRESRSVYRYAQIFPNSAFMGLPLLQAVMGEGNMIYGVPNIVVFVFFQWTLGVWMLGGKFAWKKLILNPGVLSILTGLTLFLTQLKLPQVVSTGVAYLSGMNTPLAMVIIGVQMSQSDLGQVFRTPSLYALSALRLVVLPLLTLALMLPLRRVDPQLFCALVILGATPVAAATSVMAQQYGQDAASAAQAVSLSTLLSMGTLPLFAVLAQSLV